MSLSVNIANPGNSAAPAPTAASPGDKPAGPTDLFAMLLALIGGAVPAAGDAQQQGNSSLEAVLGSLQAGLSTETPEPAEQTDLAAIVTDLLNSLKALKDGKDGTVLDPAQLEAIGKGLDVLVAYVEGLAQPVAPAEPATTAMTAAIDPDILPAKSEAAAPPSPAPLPPADSKLLQALRAAQPDLKGFAQSLQEVAPDISSKLQSLIDAAANVRPSTSASAPQPATAASAATDPQTLEILANAGNIAKPQLAGEKNAASGPKIAKPALDGPTITTANATSADATPKPAAPAKDDKPATTRATIQANAATDSTAPAVAKAGESSPSDPLLFAQNHAAAHLEASGAVKPPAGAYQTPGGSLNVPAIAFEMARQVKNGFNRFQIRLDPPEMGKIDVRMDIDGNGGVNARLSVERPETLDLLQRDARGLEKALQQAGLDSGKTNLEFSLKQNPFARQDGGFAGNQQNLFDYQKPEISGDEELSALPQVVMSRGYASPGGINLWV